MPVLSSAERLAVWQRFMELGHCPPTVLKADLRAALDAIDDWLETNALLVNAIFPLPFRTSATPAQKAFVVAIVAARRAGESLD